MFLFSTIRNAVLLFLLAGLYIAYYNMETIAPPAGVDPTTTTPRPPTPAECRCFDNTTEIEFNFCYAPPHFVWAQQHSAAAAGDSTQTGPGDSTKMGPGGSTQTGPGDSTQIGSGGNIKAKIEAAKPIGHGRRFDCRWLETVKRLGLLDEDGFVDLTSGDPIPPPVFVTGVSNSHYVEELRMLSLVQRWFPQQKVIVYDLGLNAAFQDDIRQYCNVEYRKFPFSSYPDYAALKEFKAIWWMDSSVHWKKDDLSHIYSLLTCQGNLTHGMRSVDRLHRKTDLIERNFSSPWDQQQWRESMRRCDKFPYMLHSFTGHGIYSATHSGLYSFLPTDIERLKGQTAAMYEAGFVFAVRTREIVQSVLKWYVLCALEKDCMAPNGSKLRCRFKKDRFAYHGGCHRYDQSVVNLLLANANAYNSYYWMSGIDDFFDIVRDVNPDDRVEPRKCSAEQAAGGNVTDNA